MVNFFKAYSNPNKYAEDLPSEKVLADLKVDIEGVNRIRNKIDSGEMIKAIVVVKHPKKDYYAVLDGHHRFWAQKTLGYATIKCAVIEDFFGLGFHMTKNGIFQPDPRFTRYVRIPLKRFYSYITEFIKDPENSLKKIDNKLFQKDDF
jgi:hypothetical protein